MLNTFLQCHCWWGLPCKIC